MRRVTAKQIAVMATATAGVVVTVGVRLRVPLMALTPIMASQDAFAIFDELDEVVVSATAYHYDVIINRIANNHATPVGRQVGNSSGGQSMTTTQKAAQRCALMFSKLALQGNYGQNDADGYTTEFNQTQYAWGSDTASPPVKLTSTYVNPSPPTNPTLYGPIDGRTSHSTSVSTIYVLNNVRDATAPPNGPDRSLKKVLVNSIVHEWYHQWFPLATEQAAITAGNNAEAAFVAAGGDSLTCMKSGS